MPPADTAIPPTEVPPTDTPVPPTSTPTPEPPTDTPSPTAKPTQEPKTLAISAEEIVGAYSTRNDLSYSGCSYLCVLVLGEDGALGLDRYDANGSRTLSEDVGTWWFEDGQLKLDYRSYCFIDTVGGKGEGIVGTYEVHYRMLGEDKPARLYFTKVDDQCLDSLDWTGQPWNRYEP